MDDRVLQAVRMFLVLASKLFILLTNFFFFFFNIQPIFKPFKSLLLIFEDVVNIVRVTQFMTGTNKSNYKRVEFLLVTHVLNLIVFVKSHSFLYCVTRLNVRGIVTTQLHVFMSQ